MVKDWRRPDLSGSWGTLLCLCPVLRPRQDRCHQALTVQRHGPRNGNSEGSHDSAFSGLHSTAWALTVYASPGKSPCRDARLVFGCGPGSPGRDWLPAGFRRKVSELLLTSLSPFPSFPDAMPFCHGIGRTVGKTLWAAKARPPLADLSTRVEFDPRSSALGRWASAPPPKGSNAIELFAFDLCVVTSNEPDLNHATAATCHTPSGGSPPSPVSWCHLKRGQI